MKKISTNTFRLLSICLVIILNLLFGLSVHSQTTIYNENFDASQTMLPTGWTTNHWMVDSSNNSNNTNASALNNVVIKNDSGNGDWFLMTRSISTIGYDSISVIWDARLSAHFLDSGSVITSFDFSKDNGTTWNNLPYTENAALSGSPWLWDNDSIRITLPATANNQSSIMFRWVAHIVFNASGTYRIDDFNVAGVHTTSGVESVNAKSDPYFILSNNILTLKLREFSTSKTHFTLSSVDGREILNSNIESVSQTFDLNNIPSGIYFINIVSSEKTIVEKIYIGK